MKRLALLLGLVLSFLALACTSTGNIPFIGPTSTPKPSPTATLPPPTPTPIPTPTPTPTPTPPPGVRITNGDRARFEGDWERALLEYQTAFNGSTDPDIQSAALLGIARASISAGEYQQGIDSLNNLIATFPQSPDIPHAHFALAQAYSGLGNYNEAAQEYLNYMALRPGVIDAYALNLRGDVLQASGDYAGALLDFRAAMQSPSFLNSLSLEIKTAQAHAAVGDYATALGIYQGIYDRTQDEYTKSQMDYLMGQAFVATGQTDQAYAAYQDAVNNYPTSYYSYLSLVELVNAGVPVDDLNRGIVDYFAGEYGVARAAFDRYFQSNPADPATARYYNGLALRALGGFAEAVGQWDMIIQNYPEDRFWDKAWEQKAYTQWSYMLDYNQGIQTLLDFVSANPNHPRAAEFLYDAADVSERKDLLDQAATLWERVATDYPGYEKSQQALFLAGIARYRLGDYQNALTIFQRALASALSLQERAQASFWVGKAYYALKDLPSAQSTWEITANIDPTGYYSERARDILRQRAPFSPPETYDLSIDGSLDRAEAEDWLRSTFAIPSDVDLSSPGSLLGDPRLVRGTELWELGLYEDARKEFEDLRASVQADPANSYRLANYLLDLGMYRSAILAARQVLDLAGMSDADTMAAPAYFNHVRFGAYFYDLIISAAQQYNFNPLFLFSVVRQESAFEGFVRSFAGARGLMQIIPATGQEIVSTLRWPEGYTDDDLYRPNVSVQLGANYLAKWRDYFNGDLYAALAAYNGGPGNAIEWQKLANGDPDLFLEIVRFDETRNYLRGIYEIYSIYHRLYDRTP
jgi:soluble lytic murein transglycosylase